MSELIDSWADKLLALVEESAGVQDLSVGRDREVDIGEEINTAGGFLLMKVVARRTGELGRMGKQPHALGYVERWWNGIGRWMS